MSEQIVVKVPVQKVVLMEDRAKIYRHGSLDLKAGVQQLLIHGIAHAANDKTLLVKFNDSNVQVVSAAIHRDRLSQEQIDAEEASQLQTKQKLIERALKRKQSDAEYMKQRIDALGDMESHNLQEIIEDVSINKDKEDEWQGSFARIDEMRTTLIKEYLQLTGEIKKQEEELRDLNIKMHSLNYTVTQFVYQIVVDVEVQADGSYTVDIDYVTPNACWRPCYTATLVAQDRLHMDVQAAVWQHTGEPWNDVELYFSTQRASLGVKPPELGEDLLNAQKKSEQIIAEMREQTVQSTGLGSEAAAEMPGVYDGGEVINLKAQSLHSVQSNGRSYIADIDAFETACEQSIVCMPEIQVDAIIKTTQKNQASIPLLAGPVDLIRNGGKVGRAAIDYIATGESFALGWGPDADIRVQRWGSEHRPKAGMMSSWEELEKQVRIMLSNIGGATKQVMVQERIPVSELEQVKVELNLKETTQGQQADENGLVTWNVSIPGNQTESLKIVHTIKKKKSVQEA